MARSVFEKIRLLFLLGFVIFMLSIIASLIVMEFFWRPLLAGAGGMVVALFIESRVGRG
ncbi:MAG: hypothetical protein K9L68_04400 [Spirochaetales bacterium]|nr:hypothetical protein [Spirochaetales bacterium]MCF7937818.1 hypothetical protein [Spirochaetales bacterium]